MNEEIPNGPKIVTEIATEYEKEIAIETKTAIETKIAIETKTGLGIGTEIVTGIETVIESGIVKAKGEKDRRPRMM